MCENLKQFAEVNEAISCQEAVSKAAHVMEMLTRIEKEMTLIDALLKYAHTETFFEMHQLSIKFFELLRGVLDPIVGVPTEFDEQIEDIITSMGYTVHLPAND